jgi:hypothetical protein
MFRVDHRSPAGSIVLLALAVFLGACSNAAADRLADLPVMTTTPAGATEVSRASGSEIGSWPTTPVMATVTYRITSGDPEDAIERLREVAIASGWRVEPRDPGQALRGSMMTPDGLARLSATVSLRGDELLVTVSL